MKNKILIACSFAIFSIIPVCAQKIFMLGDSHVFAKIYPETTAEIIKETYPEIEFNFWGKNGAEFFTYNTTPEYLDSLYAFCPDILIVHLGTNDSYGKVFDKNKFRMEMETFCNNIHENIPECKIVMVTPFINKRWLNKKRTKWRVNKKTRECADEMLDFAKSYPDIFVIDNNADAGMSFLNNRALIRHDNVHLTEQGYKVLAQQIAGNLVNINDLWATHNDGAGE